MRLKYVCQNQPSEWVEFIDLCNLISFKNESRDLPPDYMSLLGVHCTKTVMLTLDVK